MAELKLKTVTAFQCDDCGHVALKPKRRYECEDCAERQPRPKCHMCGKSAPPAEEPGCPECGGDCTPITAAHDPADNLVAANSIDLSQFTADDFDPDYLE